MTRRVPSVTPSPARVALLSAKSAFFTTAALSGFINLLMLAAPLFMLQVYDRVLPSQSVPTLQALVLMVVVLYACQAMLETVRSRLFVRIGRHVDAELCTLAFETNLGLGLSGQAAGKAPTPLRDLDQLRSFLAGGGPSAIFDLPWMPLYVAVLFILHPALGALGVLGAALLAAMTFFTDFATGPHQRMVAARGAEAGALAESARRNAETIVPLGMTGSLAAVWRERNQAAGAAQLRASDVASGLSGASRFIRMMLQSLVLAVGAYLVLSGKASGGVMIAGSITLGRALAPVEVAIVHWRGFVSARQAYRRLEVYFGAGGEGKGTTQLPAPVRSVAVEHLFVSAPGVATPFVKDVNFTLTAGDALAIVGASGSGKSTVVRALLGLWPTHRGSVRLDGSTLNQWSRTESGRWIGYLPQSVELFAGTISENIARFDPAATSEEVPAAARMARVDTLIRSMPEGFDTQVGDGGGRLSAGQRQRVALARALFRDPFLVVLDEPNSSLDGEGEAALTQALIDVRRRGCVAIMVAHRPAALQAVSHVLVMAEGMQKAYGPRDEILQRLAAPAAGGSAGRQGARDAAE